MRKYIMKSTGKRGLRNFNNKNIHIQAGVL